MISTNQKVAYIDEIPYNLILKFDLSIVFGDDVLKSGLDNM